MCRPNRTRPRKVTVSGVVRFARAAVRDGAAECDVVDAVVAELGCAPCSDLLLEVDESLDVVIEVRDRIRNALIALFLALDITYGQDKEEPKIIDELLGALKSIVNIISIADAFLNLVLVCMEAVELLGGVSQTLAEVAECIGKSKES